MSHKLIIYITGVVTAGILSILIEFSTYTENSDYKFTKSDIVLTIVNCLLSWAYVVISGLILISFCIRKHLKNDTNNTINTIADISKADISICEIKNIDLNDEKDIKYLKWLGIYDNDGIRNLIEDGDLIFYEDIQNIQCVAIVDTKNNECGIIKY